MSVLQTVLALLAESRRAHDHCDDDSWYCCGACRHPDHELVDGEFLQVFARPNPRDVCTCGAAAWNARVDAVLADIPS